MSEIPKRREYFLSPDGMRKLSQLMKSHFDSYTKKDMMYNDSKGLQYNGSVYNFGSEILVESNKLKMTRPPIRNITYGKDTTFYFDIKYSDLTDTYDQQNMLVCNIKKDSLIASHTYRLKFNNVSVRYMVRSSNTSAGNRLIPESQKKVQQSYVERDMFYETDDFPILVETYTDENNETVTIPHTLRIKDNGTFPTFYFHYNELTECFVDNITDGVLTSVSLDESMCELPLIWFTVESFRYLPKYQLLHNSDIDGNPILTFGTDGNGVCRLYPNCYNSELPHEMKWWLKVDPKEDFTFIPDDEPGDHNANYSVPIKRISLVYNQTVNGMMYLGGSITTIEIPDDMIVYLDKASTWGYSSWHFNRRTSEDYDWDSVYYNNPNYGYHIYDTDSSSLLIQSFTYNHMTNSTNLRPGFRVIFRNEYLYEWESDLIKAVSGMHIDSTDERSNNGVIERNGVSHNMGEFTGLPSYMKIQLDEKVHRSHMEVYAIRDHNNKYNQTPMVKQTAGLILDSGIPQNQLPEMIMSEPHIKYDIIESNKYETVDREGIISENNVLSNIVFVDTSDNTLSDYTKRGMKKFARFFYHGSNYFSLSVLEMDPDTEYGRGFVVSNDPSYYENNYLMGNVKPSRTLARICDIPTSMMQLANIPDYAPTILIDWNGSPKSYVRTWCNYTVDDKNRVLNCPFDKLIVGDDIVFSDEYDLNNLLGTTGDRYKEKDRLNETINLSFGSDGNTTISIDNAGSGYEIGDEFKFNIGGRFYNGTVDDCGAYGSVIDVVINDTMNDINVNNLTRNGVYQTTTIRGGGSELSIRLTIDENEWSSHQMRTKVDYLEGLYVYKFDSYGHVWIWTYDNELNKWNQHIQLTGTRVIPNVYDVHDTNERKMVDVYTMNLLNNSRNLYYETFTTKPNSHTNLKTLEIETDISPSDINMEDISTLLDDCKINYQNSFYMPKVENTTVVVQRFTRYPYEIQNSSLSLYYHQSTFPRFNTLNLPNWFNIGNRIAFSIMRDRTKSQPSLYYYNPNETKYTKFNYISSDYCTINEQHELSLYDILGDSLSDRSDLFIAPENIYQYDDYTNTAFEEEYTELNNMTRNELLLYIRNTIGENALPLTVETTNPYTKKMLVSYCLTIPTNPYQRSSIKRVVQRYGQVAQRIYNEDETSTIVPLGDYRPTGMFEAVSDELHDLEYTTTMKDTTSDILFVFTVMKNSSLVDLRHFHIIDENNTDISKHSILIYDGKCYVFDSVGDTWKLKI